MASDLSYFIRPFTEAEPYDQKEPGEAYFSWLLKQEEIPGLTIGRVELVGPIHKTPAAHADWHQVYLVLEGSGTVYLPSGPCQVQGGAMVVIPRNTMHSVKLEQGETLKYLFVNQSR